MATATTDTSTAIRCMKAGAYDYLVKPFDLDEVTLSVDRALEKRRLELENRIYQQHLEEMVAERTEELRQAIGRIKLASLDTIHRLARAAEYRDEDTGAHIQRMSQYSVAIARKMGIEDREVENILYAAPMHDVGKIAICTVMPKSFERMVAEAQASKAALINWIIVGVWSGVGLVLTALINEFGIDPEVVVMIVTNG